MTRWTALALLAVAFAGCGGTADGHSGPQSFVFSPDPELDDVTREWAARWSTASGLDISVGEGGTLVRLNDGYYESAGLCASHTTGRRLRGVIQIDRTTGSECASWGYALAHEMGHALGAEHSETGVMRATLPVGHVYVIDAASLEQVCASVACQAFKPEEGGS